MRAAIGDRLDPEFIQVGPSDLPATRCTRIVSSLSLLFSSVYKRRITRKLFVSNRDNNVDSRCSKTCYRPRVYSSYDVTERLFRGSGLRSI